MRTLLLLIFTITPQASILAQALEPTTVRRVGVQLSTGETAFAGYRESLLRAAEQRGDRPTAQALMKLEPGKEVPPELAGFAAQVLRDYLAERYADSLVNDLRVMIGFRTHAVEGRKNWGLPEFERQGKWLEKRARDSGFEFRNYDGRVHEITFGNSDSILALLTHGDVQPVEGQQWTSPPWEGIVQSGKIIGRGAQDDKGPIVAALYAMKALRDSRWRVGSSIKLLVANGEESDWSEIPYYLERAPVPGKTMGIDATYPVTYAQKGFGVISVRVAKPASDSTSGAWIIESLSGGSGLSIIPSDGEALLSSGLPPDNAVAVLREKANRWTQDHPSASLRVTREGNRIRVAAKGKGGHSSNPRNGHNALGDLTAFLATLDLRMNQNGLLVAFVGRHIGTETDGKSLDLSVSDDLLGSLTVNLAVIRSEAPAVAALSSVRLPRGLSREEADLRLQRKAKAFNERHGASVVVEYQQATSPHVADKSLVSALLSVWEEVMGTPGSPVAIGGGTQARLFPDGVDFGPGFPNEVYRGHSPDEYLTIEELVTIAKLTVSALWKLSMVDGR